MDCSCVYQDILQYPDFYHREERKARKEHRCNECKRVIEKGETYTRECCKYESYFDIFKTCSDCISLRETFFCEGFCFQEIHSQLIEHIVACDGEISEKAIAGLTKRAREFVCKEIEHTWERYEEEEHADR